MKKNILEIGPYTAVGGVSIHIKRLAALLKGYYNFTFIDESPRLQVDSEVFNLRSKNIFKYCGLIYRADVVHIHSGIWWLTCFHISTAFIFRKKIIVSIHSLSNLKNNFSIKITQLFLSLATKVIFVSQEIYEKFKSKNGAVIHAFIPPDLSNEKDLPSEVLSILKKNTDKKIIVNNASKLVLHRGQDLYGMDLLIDVAHMIKKENNNYKIIFVVASREESLNLFDLYQQRIKDEKLENQITLIHNPISFVKLMVESDLVVRATNTDGDALTVREALFLNRPIIASDVTFRPEGTILFKNRDSEDLYLKINETLNKSKREPVGLSEENLQTYRKKYISIYKFL